MYQENPDGVQAKNNKQNLYNTFLLWMQQFLIWLLIGIHHMVVPWLQFSGDLNKNFQSQNRLFRMFFLSDFPSRKSYQENFMVYSHKETLPISRKSCKHRICWLNASSTELFLSNFLWLSPILWYSSCEIKKSTPSKNYWRFQIDRSRYMWYIDIPPKNKPWQFDYKTSMCNCSNQLKKSL